MEYTPDEIRAYRQAKLDKKVARMRAKAQKLEKEAEGKQAAFNAHRGDTAFMTQPASLGSSFGRQRQKIADRYGKGIELQIDAQSIEEKAARMEERGIAVRGDAERARQEMREQQDTFITVGSKVKDACYGSGEVLKVNKKTYTIRFAPDFITTRDKTYVSLVESV